MKGTENPGKKLDKIVFDTTKKTIHDPSVAQTPEKVVDNVLKQ